MRKLLKDPIFYLVLTGSLFTFFAPIVFSLPAIVSWLDFSENNNNNNNNNISNTISGTTAPVIGILGIILIYITYKSQKEELESTRDFVKTQTKTIELDQIINSIENLLKETIDSIEKLEFITVNHLVHPPVNVINKGSKAIQNYTIASKDDSNFMDEYNAVLIRFEILILTTNRIKDNAIKIDYLSRIYTTFYSKILWNTQDNIFTKEKEDIMKLRDDTKIILPKYVLFSIDTIQFLLKNGLVKNSEYKTTLMTSFSEFLRDYKIN